MRPRSGLPYSRAPPDAIWWCATLMAHILIVTRGLPSLLYPSVELGRRLAAAGHRVTFATRAEDRGLVDLNCLAFLPLDPSHYDEFASADAGVATLRRLLDLRRRREQAKTSLGVDGFVQAVRDMRPDLVLINGEMHEHVIAACDNRRMPIVLLNSFRVDLAATRPPSAARAGAARESDGRAAGRESRCCGWSCDCGKGAGHGCRTCSASGATGCRRSRLWQKTRTSTSIVKPTTSQWLIPFTYRRLPVLSLHALEFEFPHRPPAHVHYVGPMVLERRIDRPLTQADRAELERSSSGVARRRVSGRSSMPGLAPSSPPTWLREAPVSGRRRSSRVGSGDQPERPDRALDLDPLPRAGACVRLGAATDVLKERGRRGDPRRHQHRRRVRRARRADAGVLAATKRTWRARPHAWCITESALPAIGGATVLGTSARHIDRLLQKPHFKQTTSGACSAAMRPTSRTGRRTDDRFTAYISPGIRRRALRHWQPNAPQADDRDTARRVAAGAGWLYVYRWLERLLDFLAIVVLARLLSPGDFGLVADRRLLRDDRRGPERLRRRQGAHPQPGPRPGAYDRRGRCR